MVFWSANEELCNRRKFLLSFSMLVEALVRAIDSNEKS